ncbi:porin family protein [Pseudohoeflea suaedae]|uniref:Porin family protein n=1 Tax=Pseudohoeflea suaedae TaxID=877384 RepID=A0A4R5PHD8_9HYPH|nr:outer membrane protein [Pseudohoeflea suaedae]TDH34324.1 porin family protein [Pseudohoeflea suaedae]
MKTPLQHVAAAALLALCANAASAADIDTAPIASSGWSGLFVGLHAGHSWGIGPDSDEFIDKMDTDGFSGGALVGYNFQFDRVVFGFEADVSGGDMRQEPLEFLDDGSVQSAEIDYTASLRGRLGYDMGDWMPFVTAGLGIADVKFKDDFFGFVNNDRQTFIGYVLGGGAEFKLDSLLSTGTDGKLLGRVEYLYTDYDDEVFDIPFDLGPSDLETHTVRAALIWRFN